MNNREFKEIFVFEKFEIKNGVLGLDRDCYLSIVKFLDSSILRKVLVNIFFLYLLLFIYFINSFFIIICIYSEIEFIKPLDDVKIRRKTITFTKNWEHHTVFINKVINSGIMRMFIFL
jgi:hypothetical protein